MDKENKKNNLIAGVSAFVGSTLSSNATEAVINKNIASDEDELVPQRLDISIGGSDNVTTNIDPSTNEEIDVPIVPQNDDVHQISLDDIILDPEPVLYGGPIPDDIDPIDIDCVIYGGPADMIG